MNRSHTCGELTIKNINQIVTLNGWVKKIRKIGPLVFVDLRDRYGITQLVIENSDIINDVKSEYVLEVKGKVIERKSKNMNMPTGDIEIVVDELKIINKSLTTPFLIEDNIEINEDTRLQYRYLDLRRPVMQSNLMLRSQINQIIRNFLINKQFIEIETPYFGKSTPEGARDFVVPSRMNPNKFYALPQSPQLYKQLLMISGMDKYFQIVRCFRDENLRLDRQLEFTQLDIELSFATSQDIMKLNEELIFKIFKEVKNIDISYIPKMTYQQAIEDYGIDKPDLRFDLKIKTLNDIFEGTKFKLFANNTNQSIRGISYHDLINKKELEVLTEEAKQNSLNILAILKVENDIWTGSGANNLSDLEKVKLKTIFNINNKATILLGVEEYNIVSQAMGAIRNKIGEIFSLKNPNEYKLVWIVDFPLFEWSKEHNRYVAAHHPFTMPKLESLNNFENNKENALANAYDLVLNGFELGGGSERITDPIIQQRMFDAIGLTEQQIDTNFGWFIKAYNYGAPNHAGIAWGLDRLLMILSNSVSIRDLIAFPKNSSGIDPMNNAPSFISEQQLEELKIKTK